MIAPKIIAHLSKDERLAAVIQAHTMLEWGVAGDVYSDLLGSIISQQISVKAAATIQERFLGLFADGYPHADQLLAFDETELRTAGLSRQKAGYMHNIARFFQEENLLDYDWAPHSDEEIVRWLTQIKGVGRWTVEMILMFTLQRPDVFPLDDLGIRNAMIKIYEIEATGKALKQHLLDTAEPWRPYRTYACRYLWRWKDA